MLVRERQRGRCECFPKNTNTSEVLKLCHPVLTRGTKMERRSAPPSTKMDGGAGGLQHVFSYHTREHYVLHPHMPYLIHPTTLNVHPQALSPQASPHWPSLLGSRRVTQERRGMFSPVFCRFDCEAFGSPQTQSAGKFGTLSRLRGVPTFCPNFSNIVSLELLKNALNVAVGRYLIN